MLSLKSVEDAYRTADEQQIRQFIHDLTVLECQLKMFRLLRRDENDELLTIRQLINTLINY